MGTDREAFPEVVDRPEVGRLFDDAGGERALARALMETLELAEDPSTTGACRARAGEFSAELATEQHLALYRELLELR